MPRAVTIMLSVVDEAEDVDVLHMVGDKFEAEPIRAEGSILVAFQKGA